MNFGSIEFDRNLDRSRLEGLSAVHTRLFGRLVNWKTALVRDPRILHHNVSHWDFLRYLLSDAEADVVCVADALADLKALGLMRFEIPDPDVFREGITAIARDIEMSRAMEGLQNAN